MDWWKVVVRLGRQLSLPEGMNRWTQCSLLAPMNDAVGHWVAPNWKQSNVLAISVGPVKCPNGPWQWSMPFVVCLWRSRFLMVFLLNRRKVNVDGVKGNDPQKVELQPEMVGNRWTPYDKL